MQPGPGDHVVDVGACLGNTALAFATAITDTGHVYAFDPIGSHIEIIRHNLAQNPRLENRITVFPYALGRHGNNLPGPLPMVDIADPGFTLNQSEAIDRIPIRTIDDLVESGDLKRVDFIKMDIEGFETEALRGAENSIRKYKPRLAICIYHKFSDLFEIPLLINRLNPGYKFYIAHYTIHTEETVLYATME